MDTTIVQDAQPVVEKKKRVGNYHNALKTHCTHGHEFTPENTKVLNGRRYCRQCLRDYQNQHYSQQVAASGKPQRVKTVKKPALATEQVVVPASVLEGLFK